MTGQRSGLNPLRILAAIAGVGAITFVARAGDPGKRNDCRLSLIFCSFS